MNPVTVFSCQQRNFLYILSLLFQLTLLVLLSLCDLSWSRLSILFRGCYLEGICGHVTSENRLLHFVHAHFYSPWSHSQQRLLLFTPVLCVMDAVPGRTNEKSFLTFPCLEKKKERKELLLDKKIRFQVIGTGFRFLVTCSDGCKLKPETHSDKLKSSSYHMTGTLSVTTWHSLFSWNNDNIKQQHL